MRFRYSRAANRARVVEITDTSPEWYHEELAKADAYRPARLYRRCCRFCECSSFPIGAARHCSAACILGSKQRNEAERRRRIREHNASMGGRFAIVCDHCREEFRSQRSNAVYCSTRCRVAAHRGHKRLTAGATGR